MPYITNVSSIQIAQAPTSGTVQVEWTVGNLVPDLVDITHTVDSMTPPVLIAELEVSQGSGAPMSNVFNWSAPAFLNLVVSPRLLENGVLADQMPDDEGNEQAWEAFQVVLPLLTVAASSDGSGRPDGRPGSPTITGASVAEGQFTVTWSSPNVHHFNVTVLADALPFEGQFEVEGSRRRYVDHHLTAGTYRFSIQGCHRRLFGDQCSPWVGTDIVLPPELGFVAWRRWITIHPETVFNQSTPVAALSPEPDHLDLFKVGFDGAVWTTFFHADDKGWRPWRPIHPETVFAQDAPITCLASRPGHIDLFTTGLDGNVLSTFFRAGAEPPWRTWFSIHPGTIFRQDRPVAAVARTQEHVDLFRIGFDGAVWTSFFHADAEGWRPWRTIRQETRFPAEAYVTALSTGADHIDLFTVGHDGAVWTTFWHADGQGWRPWRPIHPEVVFPLDQQVVALSRIPGLVDLFIVGHDGAVWSSFWNAAGDWRPWFTIYPEARFSPSTRVTAISRKPDNIDLFITGLGGHVWTSFFRGEGGGWHFWRPIQPQTVFSQRHPVAVVSRRPEHIDVFKVGFDAAIWTAWWAP